MRPVLAVALVAVLTLVAAAPAEGAINRPRAFHESFGYMPALDSPEKTVVSGAIDADIVDARSAYGFFDSDGSQISGLTRVCWVHMGTPCSDSASRQLSLTLAPGSSFALCFPGATSGRLHAEHALALYVDLAQDDDLNSFSVDKSIVAPVVDGSFAFSSIPAIASVTATSPACSGGGGLAGLDDATQLTIRDGSSVLATLTGKNAVVSFAGQPSVPAIAADFVIIPFAGASTSDITTASDRDAERGLDLNRVQELIRALDASHQSSNVERGRAETGGNNTQAVLAGMLNGAFVQGQFPTEGQPFRFEDIHFVRFKHLSVDATATGLSWDGKAYLEVKDGDVRGAHSIVGFGWFKLPWWSYLLIAIAIGLSVTRMILKPDKSEPRWDRLRWIGWVFSIVTGLLVFWLWDLEFRAVLGASYLHGTSGQFRLVIGGLQNLMLGIIWLALIWPMRSILRSTSMLMHQGTFMGLAGGVATIFGFLAGAAYIRAYLGLILTKVMERLA